MSPARRILGSLLVVAALVLTVFSIPVSASIRAGEDVAVTGAEHAPILISGDANFTAANGVVSGSGPWYDPFVIANWTINASSQDGIQIRNTTAYVVLRDLRVVACSEACVELSSLSHAALIDSTLETAVDPDQLNEAVGLRAFNVTDLGVVSTVIEGPGYGIGLFSSTGVTLDGVKILGDPDWSPFDGILIDRSRSVVVQSSAIGDHGGGIFAYRSSDLNLSRNRIWSDSVGILLLESENASFVGNHFAWESPGVRAEKSRNLTILGNAFSGVGPYVAYLNATVGSVTYHNDVFNTVGDAFDSMGPQNAWDGGYPAGGNWWGIVFASDNCSGPAQDVCTGPDGIQDGPWPIDANSTDRYPFDGPVAHVDLPPVAEFQASPAAGDTDTVFEMNASASLDLETWNAAYRWDWNGDGTWDTEWSSSATADHVFSVAGTYAVAVEAEDTGGQTDTFARSVVVVQAPDRVAPTIVHTPATNLVVGQHLSVSVEVTDAGGVSNVTLFYALPGDSTYHSLPMIRMSPPTYNAVVPAPDRAGVLRYYVVASDPAGNEARLPLSGTFNVTVASVLSPDNSAMLVLVLSTVGVAAVAAVAGYLMVRRRRGAGPPPP